MYNGSRLENSGGTKVCKYCYSTIDKRAKICPHCRKRQPAQLTLGGVIAIIVAVLIWIYLISGIDAENFRKSAETVLEPPQVEVQFSLESNN